MVLVLELVGEEAAFGGMHLKGPSNGSSVYMAIFTVLKKFPSIDIYLFQFKMGIVHFKWE